MTNPIIGEFNYLAACTESTWGTLPGSPSWVFLPCLSYGVKLNTERRQSPVQVGVMQEKHNQTVFGSTGGTITMPLYGWWPANSGSISQMQWILAWAMGTNLESKTRASKSLFWAEGPDIANKIHTGSVVGSWTLSGAAGSPVTMSLDIMGYDEIGMDDATNRADTAPTIPTDMNQLTEVLFEDTTLTLGGSSTEIKAFTIKQNFNLTVGREAANRPSFIVPKKVVTDVAFTIRKTADTWDQYNRDTDEVETTASLAIKGLHRGTGSTGDYTVATIAFNRLSLMAPATEGGKDAQYLNVGFRALKPDSSSASMAYTMSEA